MQKNVNILDMQMDSVAKPKFPCEQCNKHFLEPNQLKMHMKIHSGEKVFACNQCSYSCSVAGSLKTHMRTHSGEKPFFCQQCTKKWFCS